MSQDATVGAFDFINALLLSPVSQDASVGAFDIINAVLLSPVSQDASVGAFDIINGTMLVQSSGASVGAFTNITTANPTKMRVWDGSQWQVINHYVWNGSSWVVA